jgi:hypothetical protein
MRKMKWGTGTVSCGLCNTLGHNIRKCPYYEDILKEAEEIFDNGNKGTVGKYKYYTWQHQTALREKDKRANKKPKTPSSKPRKCSFCKLTGHTKRNCTFKAEVKDLFYDANTVWRTAFVKRAKEVGIAPGALLKLRRFQSYSGGVGGGGWKVYRNVMTLVTGADWDELTFMNSYGMHWQYQSLWFMTHHLAIPESDVHVKIGQPELKQFYGSLFFADPAKSMSVQNIEVIAKADIPLGDAWAHNKEVKELDWLIAQHSHAELDRDLSIIPWAKKIIKDGICP